MTKNTKPLLSFFLITVGFINLSAQTLLRPEHQFNGEVSKIYEAKKVVFQRTEVWNFKKQEFQSGEIISFDKKGNYKKSISYIFPDSPYLTTNYKSNSNGNLKNAEAYLNYNKNLITQIHYYENTSGLIDSVVHSVQKDNKRTKVISYEYSKGKIAAYRKEELGKDTFKVVYKRLEDTIEEETIYDDSGNITSTKKHEYNQQGDPVIINIYDADNKLINQQTNLYKYDEKGNWIKRLNTDIRSDHRILTERDIIYGNVPNQNISKKELIGFWVGWGNNFTLEVKPSMLKIENMRRRYGLEGESAYTPATGILTLKAKSEYARDQDYYTTYDGKILTIRFRNKGEFFHLRKLDISILSASDRAQYIYRSSTKKLKERSFEDPIYGWLNIKDLGYLRFKKDNKYGLLDPNRKEIVPAIYDNVWVDPAGVIIVEKNQKQGIFTLAYQAIAPIEYTSLKQYNYLGKSNFNRLIVYRDSSSNNDWYDGHFRLVKSFKKYTDIKPVDINCFKMRSSDGWGLMDSLENIIIRPQYEELQNGPAQLLIAYDGKKYGLINTVGKRITDLNYDHIIMLFMEDYKLDISRDLKNQNATAIFKKGDDFGYIDGFGNEIMPALSPGIKNRHYHTRIRSEKGFSFYYPFKWHQSGQTFVEIDEDLEASLEYQKITYTGDPKQWILKKDRPGSLTEETINGIKVYKYRRRSGSQNKIILKQFIYFVISDTQIIKMTTSCPEKQYLKVAQDFYDMIYTFEIKKPDARY